MAALIGAVALAGCRGLPTGPSLSAVSVNAIALKSTTGNVNLCCCRVTATLVNDNTVPVHVSLKFSAYDGTRSDPISTTFQFVPDLEPRTPRAIDVAGFIYPCAIIKDVRTEVDVKGITQPPL